MRDVLVIGSGIAGMACAVRCAELGMRATLISPFPSERSQSVMAAGGINAVTADCEPGDSVQRHIEDTLCGGSWLAGREAVTGLCSSAEGILDYLEGIGTVFTVDDKGRPVRRAFSGQTHKRTYFSGSSTGKQIVSALVMEARRHEAAGSIIRRLRMHFHSALIVNGVCYGALMFDESRRALVPLYASAVVVATGGQNSLFGKTTGSSLCDGYVAGRLFTQGAVLKNLEFIQYHPTTIETAQKRMLVSEAVRGEGGRLFYEKNGERVYFLEDTYGSQGNLISRDVLAREIHAIEQAGDQVLLDISFLGERLIEQHLEEVRDLCLKYRGIDVLTQPIPVEPSVHFFMGGLAVHMNHETSIDRLYAVGECASMYHGANRLGGNSLLAAIYGGRGAADDISGREEAPPCSDFAQLVEGEQAQIDAMYASESTFPVAYMHDLLAESMQKHMGIVRTKEGLVEGIKEVEYYQGVADCINYDPGVSMYANYSFPAILALGHACLTCANERTESRGAHYRSDAPDTRDDFAHATLISLEEDGSERVWLDEEGAYER